MIQNYFKIAWRNLWRNKAFSAINIFGLAIGIATCLIILLYLQNELSYDRFNVNADSIVRVVFRGKVSGGNMNEAAVMPPVAQTLKADYPEVTAATRLREAGMPVIIYGDKTFKGDKAVYADANFFEVFTLPLIEGDVKDVLQQPNTVVISKAMANKYFGKDVAVGKILNFKSWNTSYKVTGVFDKIPVNAHFHFDIFVSMASLADSKESSWMTSGYFTYLLLKKGVDYKNLEAKLPQAIEKYMGPQLAKSMGISLAEFRNKGNDVGLYLQPLTDIHLHSNFNYDLEPAGDIKYIYIFGAIAIFMLLIACINFMNLSTASAAKRSREVGIRKVLGSQKMELIRQFLVESVLVTAIAMLFAVAIVYTVLPFFNNLAGIKVSLDLKENLWLLPGLFAVGLFTGILAGSYPAFYLSSFNPVTVLKSRFKAGKSSVDLRSGLVVFQFFISIVLIIGTTIVYNQLSYIQHKKLGYNKDQVIVTPGWLLNGKQDIYRNLLLQDPRVLDVSISSYLPAGNSGNNNFFIYPNDNNDQVVKTLRYDVDENYLHTMGIQLQSGRNFSKEFGTDSSAIILNETAAKSLGWPTNALGHIVTRLDNNGMKMQYKIIGVVKDFHFKSLHEAISPLVMVLGDNTGNVIVKAKTADMPALLATMKTQWDNLQAEEVFDYSFLDERFNNTYKAEHKIGIILGLFAGLTIFVACLGLFGLATFSAEQRTKELGVRKVLGATVVSLVQLVSKEFLKLVIIANLIAWPLAWWVMNKWLQDFAYRINISWWVFVIAGITAIVLTIITVSFQAIKAALMNPVKSLKAE